MPDYTSSGTYGSTDTVLAKQPWGEQTRGLLGKRKSDEKVGGTQKKPKVKSLSVRVGQLLQECAGKRLLDYVPPKDSPHTNLLCLCLATDQGLDVRCAAYYMKYGLSCNVDFWFDPSHGPILKPQGQQICHRGPLFGTGAENQTRNTPTLPRASQRLQRSIASHGPSCVHESATRVGGTQSSSNDPGRPSCLSPAVILRSAVGIGQGNRTGSSNSALLGMEGSGVVILN
eukprot:408026-Amphidinium_carterae.4